MTKTVLCTGSSGFICSNLIKELSKQGYAVVGFDIKEPNTSFLGELDTEVKLYQGDCRKPEQIDYLIREADVVYHLCGQTDVTSSIQDPLNDFEHNVIGSNNVMHSCMRHGVKMIFTSSFSVYGDAKPPIPETAKLNPISPYGFSKMITEQLLGMYQRDYGLDATILRLTNVYGPMDFKSCIYHFLANNQDHSPITVNGIGDQTRDYCVSGNSLVLMGDLSWKPISKIVVGDDVVSFDEKTNNQKKRVFGVSKVCATSSRFSRDVYQMQAGDYHVTATGNHPWFMSKGKFRNTKVILDGLTKYKRKYKKQSIRCFSKPVICPDTKNYRKGFIHGSIDGDGSHKEYNYGKSQYLTITHLGVTDKEFRDRFCDVMKHFGFKMNKHEYQPKYPGSKKNYVARLGTRKCFKFIQDLFDNTDFNNFEYCRGYMAGIYDSEGEIDHCQMRFSNKDRQVIENIKQSMKTLGFRVSEYLRKDGLVYFRVLGGLQEQVRFVSLINNSIMRLRPTMVNKRCQGGHADVNTLTKVNGKMVYNIEVEGNHTFIVNGLLCHNCYVKDCVDAIIEAADMHNGVFNIGTGKQVSVTQLLSIIKDMSGNPRIDFGQEVKGDIKHSCADMNHTFNHMGWRPKVSVHKGMEMFDAWLREIRV